MSSETPWDEDRWQQINGYGHIPDQPPLDPPEDLDALATWLKQWRDYRPHAEERAFFFGVVDESFEWRAKLAGNAIRAAEDKGLLCQYYRGAAVVPKEITADQFFRVFDDLVTRVAEKREKPTATTVGGGLRIKEIIKQYRVDASNVRRWCENENNQRRYGIPPKDNSGWLVPYSATQHFPWPMRKPAKLQHAVLATPQSKVLRPHLCESCGHSFEGIPKRPPCPKCRSSNTRVAQRE
jgi:rubrerythrin